MFENCTVCGLQKVPPFCEIDITVGVMVYYSRLICEDCAENETEAEAEVAKADFHKLPF